MKDIAVAATDWGLHAVACSGLRDTPPSAWLGTLRNALSGAGSGLFLDLREVGNSPLPPSHLGALASVVAKAGFSAVLVSDLRLGHALCDAVRRDDANGETASGLRVLSADGRDRVAIAAAYQWLLNGREPAGAILVSDRRPSVVIFPTSPAQRRPTSPGSADLRHAS
ncbi:hypothetical protein TSH100_17235 [Azospirillum sp. TSH100]|uniref:hypothetical protein n=1 Tax=Azospirillum sp. TSH100 TaxID=652764 RepID=UPI000D610213|nr:hypothetical protein [Azospirillum sp. TSH100]PWC84749.1 hypothetical protein TSH100_17235 [Azospirillum sp. TSH100]QCG90161.1 hypothetical protein E6C72_20660 [Azospirillum sp. TSH100]